MKPIFTATACILLSASLSAQTLFNYGKKSVSKQEFLAAFNKNPNPNISRAQALKSYIDLYINYKLKVQAAIDEKLNETESFKTESENFKKQIADNFINEEANAKMLMQEAFQRSQKDIKVAQIFIGFGKDKDKAEAQAQLAFNELKAGKSFESVLQKYTTEESTKANNGVMEYITVFSLPYTFETEIYNLKPGGYSAPVKSLYGYHIFKNVEERGAAGNRKAAQILLMFPPNASDSEKAVVKTRVDAIYAKIKAGDNFESLAREYSNDYQTAAMGGVMGEVSVGKYSQVFEDKIYGLKREGQVSEPFVTAYGYHIVKLIEILPVKKNLDDPAFSSMLKVKLDNSDRLAIAKKGLLKKWMTVTNYKSLISDEKAVENYCDSMIKNSDSETPVISLTLNDSTPVLSFTRQKIYLGKLVQYVKNVRTTEDGKEKAPFATILKSFSEAMCMEYYRSHFDDYNTSIKAQIKEFDEANLLFAAMDKHVWGKAGEDTTGLKNQYEKNTAKYVWQPGVAAITVSANSLKLANEIVGKLKDNPADWRTIVSNYGATAVADSGRYESNQLPIKQTIENREGYLSTPEKMGNEDSYAFILVTKVYGNKETRSFEEARGLVINDYQQILEDNWLASLKKKYPVKMNEEVKASLK